MQLHNSQALIAVLPDKVLVFFTYMTNFTQHRQSYMSKLTGSKERSNRAAKSERELARVFSGDYEAVDNPTLLDPRGHAAGKWNKVFLVACLVSLFIDPLFFYLPRAREKACLDVSLPLEVALTAIRSMMDAFYVVQIVVRFRTAYVSPSSCVFGRGELVIDPSKIASKYLHRDFWLDLVAAQPLPQVLIWAAIPSLRSSRALSSSRNVLRLIVVIQYLLRLYLIFPLSSKIVKATGVVTETAWAGAAYNLMLYMLASHVLGSCWYLLATERQEECWNKVCLQEPKCDYCYFDCHRVNHPERAEWFNSSNISSLCVPTTRFFEFGIYGGALTFRVSEATFFDNYLYCLWWGLRSLSSLGQNLSTTTCVGEISFAIIIAILGLVLFSLLIGNMQTYLQSTNVRVEEWRIRKTDTEEWMRHRQLPQELRQRVRRYDQYRWIATRGANEEAILRGLPSDLRRGVKRHLCLDLVRQVPIFDQLDDQTLDAICEKLKPSLSTAGTCLAREGDPVSEMLFIIRGDLDSVTTGGGRTGFLNSCRLGSGDFCGEELLPWALNPRRAAATLPLSTRTVLAIGPVEAFALVAGDLKFVAGQFRRLHSKKIRHAFRSHSHQWRTWAACFIQAAWLRYKRTQAKKDIDRSPENSPEILSSLQKPVELDFTVEEEEEEKEKER